MGAQRLRAFHLPATSREQLRQCSTATFSNRIPSHRAPYRSDTAAPRCSIAFPLPVVAHSPPVVLFRGRVAFSSYMLARAFPIGGPA